MQRIDGELLPRFSPNAAQTDLPVPLKALEAAVEEAAFLLNEMFQGLATMEGGRDPLTRALNRRFLSSILSREIGFANANHTPLSVLLPDVTISSGSTTPMAARPRTRCCARWPRP